MGCNSISIYILQLQQSTIHNSLLSAIHIYSIYDLLSSTYYLIYIIYYLLSLLLDQVVGALVNSVFLVALCFSITVESIKRFLEPEEIKDPKLILIVGGVGLGINLVSSE